MVDNIASITHRKLRAKINELAQAGSAASGPRNVRTAEYFGAIAVNFGETTINNLIALQAAIDWSSATGGAVVLGYGDYGFDGTLALKSNMVLLGQGGTVGHTVLTQKNTSWPDCLASAVSVSASTGVSNIALRGFCVDGGWDLKNTFNTGGNWTYTLASKTQRGIFVDSPDNGADSLNRTGSPDSNNRMVDLWVRSVAGTGMYLDGRGEMMLQHLRVSKCAVDGLFLEAPDNWMSDITAATIGARGLVISGGNQRVENVKCWFIGMCKGEEVSGVGVELPGAGTTNIDGTNITTQDTWGPGIRVAGSLISLQGRIDEAGGGRVQQQGNGFQGTRTKDRTALEIGNLKNGRVSVAINGTDRSLSSLPHAVSFKDSGADQTHVTVQIDRHSVAPYLHATLIEAVAGLASSKRHNVVHEVDGGILYGERTAAELGDAAHSVNLRKFRRQEAWDSTGNRKLFASGTAAADPWKTVDGTSVITPA